MQYIQCPKCVDGELVVRLVGQREYDTNAYPELEEVDACSQCGAGVDDLSADQYADAVEAIQVNQQLGDS